MLANIHILGIQGSGKGTQSALLVEKYHLEYLPSGDLFRARAEVRDELGQHLQEELQKGVLLPDQYLFATVTDFLQTHTIRRGLLGDGVIRTISQYEGLLPIWKEQGLDLPLLIHLKLSDEQAVQRIHQRQLEQNDPSKQQFYLTYGGKLLKRQDANPAAIEARLALFHQMTAPVIDIFQQQNRCIQVEADAAIPTIFQMISQGIDSYYPELTHASD